MERRVLISLMMVALFLIGCSSENGGDAVIKETKLSEFERNLLQLSGEAAFIHDVEIKNEQVKEIYLYIDLYKNGKHIGAISEIGTDISEEKFQTLFLNHFTTQNERNWVSAVMNNGGYASGNASNQLDGTEYQSSAWGGIIDEVPLVIGKKHPIATMVFSNQNSIGIIDDLSTEEAFANQVEYEEVYIFSIELK